MASACIPVDLTNPGQVFACLGFLEAADILCGPAEGGFDWSAEAGVMFRLHTIGDENPFASVLTFLAEAKVVIVSPAGVEGPWPDDAVSSKIFPASTKALRKDNELTASPLPIRLERGDDIVPVSHWLESGSRVTLKLFAGQQVGARLAMNMLKGDHKKKGSKGLEHIFLELKESGFQDPLNYVCPVGGRFGFDARGSWDAMRIGSSLKQQKTLVKVAPHVELLAAIGLENTRPVSLSTYQIRYAAWANVLPIILCRVALFSPDIFLLKCDYRFFRAHLGDDKQYKKLFFAEREKMK